MVEMVKLSDGVMDDIRNRELEMPGLTDHILERLSQLYKQLGRKVAFSPAGQSSGLLAGRSGKTLAASFYYHQTSKNRAALRVFTLSARIAHIFEGGGYVSPRPLITATAAAFLASNPEALIEEEIQKWAGAESGDSDRARFRSGGSE
jgi:hypothetical protein